MSLLQFGFVRKKRNQGDDNDEGTSEKGGSSKEQRLDESVVPEVPNLSTSSSYESRRVRKFQATWLRDFPWLVHESNKNQMHCKFCVEFPALADKSSPLFNGTSGFRRTTLQAHSRSKTHHTCSEAYRTRENPDAAPMDRALRNMNSQTQEKLRKLFNTAYFISKENLSFAKFPELCKLQMKNGLELGETYLNDHRCKEFVQAISSVIKNDLNDQVTARRPFFFSCMADQAVDCGVIEEEIIFIRTLENGLAVNKYATIQGVEKSDADGVLVSIVNGFKHVGINNWREGLVACGSDGASVMTGVRNGVIAKLRQEVPWLIGIHCVAHKLELAILDGIKDVQCFPDLTEMLKGRYKHYHYSAKALRELQELANIMAENCNRPVNVSGSRWVPHNCRALKVVCNKYKLIHAHMQETAVAANCSATMKGRARNVIGKLESYKHVAFMFFMLDILDELQKLSLTFQKDEVAVSDVKNALERTRLALNALLARPGTHLRKFEESLHGNVFETVTLNKRTNDDGELTNLKNRVVNVTCQYLANRFDNFENDPVLAAAKILEVGYWHDNREQLAIFGEEEINVLSDHFKQLLEKNDFNQEEALSEWLDLKVLVKNNYVNLRKQAVWQVMFSDFTERFCNILMLIEILLVLPMSTACCERGFSCMNRIKTQYRSRLDTSTLDSLLRIGIAGVSSTAFDPQRAIALWWSSGERARRPGFTRN